MFDSSDQVCFPQSNWAIVIQNGPEYSYGAHLLSEPCMMIGQLGWKKIYLIIGLKHLAPMVLFAPCCYLDLDYEIFLWLQMAWSLNDNIIGSE